MSDMTFERQFKLALDETRLLMLGSQILFGFQFDGIFQPLFSALPAHAQGLEAAALLLMTLTTALLIAPAARHRLARGAIGAPLFRAVRFYVALALFPLSLSLAIDLYIVLARVFDALTGAVAAGVFWMLALGFWYAIGFLFRKPGQQSEGPMTGQSRRSPHLADRIDHVLTEARVALPGAQALLGFQLLIILTEPFEQLPRGLQVLHAGSLLAVALSVILLIAPAAFHRIAFHGADSERFYRIGSWLVTLGLFPLALGLAGDVWVAIAKIAGGIYGGLAAGATLLVLLLLWYAHPLWVRKRTGT